MRLWHEDILPFLPRSQLLAQWRELNSIFAKEDNHILINYIYQYPKNHLFEYTKLVMQEFERRKFTIRTVDKFTNYFSTIEPSFVEKVFPGEHTDEYFEICFYNLKEKFMRGQKDFPEDLYLSLLKEYKKRARSN